MSDSLRHPAATDIVYYIGLWLSSRVTDEISAQNAAQVLGGPIAFISGKLTSSLNTNDDSE